MNDIHEIAKELKSRSYNISNLSLNNGLMGISLFFFFYSRFINNVEEKKFAYSLLEKVVEEAHNQLSYTMIHELAHIGKTIDFLAVEFFLEADITEFSDQLNTLLMQRLKNDIKVDFSFQTGLIGICDFFIKKDNANEALEITIEHLCYGIRVKGYKKSPIKPLFLFPSEILRDTKLFLLKISNDCLIPQKEILEKEILKFEFSHKVLQSNCFEYNKLQDLRESEIISNIQTVESLLEDIFSTFPNLILKGLSYMSLKNKSLPSWWKLV